MLKSTPTLCSNCHHQDERQRTLLFGSKESDFKDIFSFAEYSFMTRDYPQALQNYQKYVDANNFESQNNLNTAIERQLAIYLQVYKDPHALKFQLNKYLTYSNIPFFIKRKISSWLSGIKDLEHTFKPKRNEHFSYQQMKELLAKYFGGSEILPASFAIPEQDKPFYVILAGYLYDYLNNDPQKDEIPAILYWLSLCERAVDYSFYYSLADLYLKECIMGDPTNPYAKKCFNEYEDYITLMYSGSSGAQIPDYLQEELEQLKTAINPA